MKLQIALALVASSLCAFARIGENAEQLAKRYGNPTRSQEGILSFKKGDIYVSVTMWKGVCHSIRFSNKQAPPGGEAGGVFGGGFVLPGEEKPGAKPKAPEPATQPLTDTQIQNLLASNSGGSEWKQRKSDSWVRADGNALAFKSGDELVIETLEYSTHRTAEREKEESHRTDGF